MKLKMQIHKIKCISELTFDLPIEKGMYAITGQNGSGKSTIVACASSVFFNLPIKEYFGKTDDDSYISFELDGATRSWVKKDGAWSKKSDGKMNIKGFYEGSLIFGYRFRDTTYEKLKGIDTINPNKLVVACDFIRKNLGIILQGDENFYEKLLMVPHNYKKFASDFFFYEKNGKLISQFHMSTGENLLISVLNSIYIRNEDRASLSKPCLLFLDEIELALHPSSLKRLVQFLEDMSQQFNYAIYFSTHSIELISNIIPQNIYYIERHMDNTIEIMNPCYPAYATRMLYDNNGYDNVILVEDDLAKGIIDRLLRMERLLTNRLVHVLPCGGYTNVIDLAQDVVRFNLLGNKKTSLCIILDLDVEDKSKAYIANRNIDNNIPINFLPVQSLEKFLRDKLVINVDHEFFRLLDNYVFQYRSLTEIIGEFKKKYDIGQDKSGKKLYSLIDQELRNRRKTREYLIEIVLDYLFAKNDVHLIKTLDFLRSKFSE